MTNLLKKIIMVIASKLIELLPKQISVILYGPPVSILCLVYIVLLSALDIFQFLFY